MLLSVGWFSLILALHTSPAFLPVTPSPMPTYHATPVKAGVLLAHSLVPVRLTSPLSSSTARTGQHFGFFVARDVSVGGIVVIPRCTRGDGTVSFAGRRGVVGQLGDLRLQFESLRPADGTTLALDPVEAHVRGNYRTLTVPTDKTLFVAVAEDTYPPGAAPTCLSPAPQIVAPVPTPAPAPIATPKTTITRVIGIDAGRLVKAEPMRTAAPTPTPAPAPAPVAMAAPEPVATATPMPVKVAAASVGSADVLPANTKMSVRLAGDLNSLTAQTDEKFAFFLDQDILVGGVTRIPKCTPGSGTVSFAERAGGGGHEGTLRLRFDSLTLSDGTTMNLDPTEQVFKGQDQHGKAARNRLGMYLVCGLLCIGGGGNAVSGLNVNLSTERELFVDLATDSALPNVTGVAPVCPTPPPTASPNPTASPSPNP